MKIATYNINGVNGRLPVLLRWLKEAQPDIVCLQELKAPQENSPSPIFATPDTARSGMDRRLEWCRDPFTRHRPRRDAARASRRPRGPPQPLYRGGCRRATIGCLYLPNGNPAPGPKFDYKLAWFERLQKYGKTLIASDVPFIMAGDYNVMPTDLDVYAPERWRDDALFRPEVRKAYAEFVKLGWKDALRHLYPGKRIYTFWKYFRNAFARDAGLRIDHLLLSPSLKNRLVAGGVAREVRSWEKTSDHAPAWIELEDIAPIRFRKKARD